VKMQNPCMCVRCVRYPGVSGFEFVFSEGKKKTNSPAGTAGRHTQHTQVHKPAAGRVDFSPEMALFPSFYVFNAYICMMMMKGRKNLQSGDHREGGVCMSRKTRRTQHTQNVHRGIAGGEK
jgi:hypothetical protein